MQDSFSEEISSRNSLLQLWEKLSAVIQKRVSGDSFERWFSGVSVLSMTPESVTLGVPNPIHQFFIESNYSSLLHSAVEEVCGGPLPVVFDSSGETRLEKQEKQHSEENNPALGLLPKAAASPAKTGLNSVVSVGMNLSYTFESFIVGANNQFAHAASQAVAHAPARTYNPLFIYGGPGLGKTHLLQAIGHHVLATKKTPRWSTCAANSLPTSLSTRSRATPWSPSASAIVRQTS